MKNINKRGIKSISVFLFVFGILIMGVNATSLDSCGELTSGEYTLTQDVSSTESCFFVSSDDVSLDCNGHTITFATDASSEVGGVVAFGVNNVEVKNCVIEDGNTESTGTVGVAFIGVQNGNFHDNQVTLNSNQPMGVLMMDIGNTMVNDNSIDVVSSTQYAAGISISGQDTTYNMVSNNVVSVNGDGANGLWFYDGPSQMLIDGNSVNVNGEEAKSLVMQDASDNEVKNNEFNVAGTDSNAVRLSASNNNYLHDNDFNAEGGSALGIYDESTDNKLLNNDFVSDSQYVIYDDNGHQNLHFPNILEYDNQNGNIRWEKEDLTTGMDLTQGGTVILNYNLVGLPEDLSAMKLNSTMRMDIKGLTYSTMPKLFRNWDYGFGSWNRCDNEPVLCDHISYDATAGILSFDANFISTYKTEA